MSEITRRAKEDKKMTSGIETSSDPKILDELVSSFQPGDLIILGGSLFSGKTTFCLNIAKHVSLTKKMPVAVFSLEMDKEQLAIKMAKMAMMDASKLRGGYLSGSDWPKLTTAAGHLSDTLIFIDDPPAITVTGIREKAVLLKNSKGLGMIVIDSLQLLKAEGSSDILRELKSVALELEIPVIVSYQLRIATEERKNKRPQLSDLKEIEPIADVIIFLYRESTGLGEAIVAKNRRGAISTFKVRCLRTADQ